MLFAEKKSARSQIFGFIVIALFFFGSWSCSASSTEMNTDPSGEGRQTKTISHSGVSVQIVYDAPITNDSVDVMLVYHGTAVFDNKILEAANTTLSQFKRITENPSVFIISVAYPEENLLIGENLIHCEAALLWLRENGDKELNIKPRKVILAGHSQGGYLVSRMATLHKVDGVISNAPGPLNLHYRCSEEESRNISPSVACGLLRAAYGSPAQNAESYFARSLIRFAKGFQSKTLFVQGLNDAPIQLKWWPHFKELVAAEDSLERTKFVEYAGFGHTALFDSPEAQREFNLFLSGVLQSR